jgi:NAD-dependent SIR2 family protein deacetylase
VALELSNVKRQLQEHLQEGLLIVVGSGLSAAEGIPGMWTLAQHLKKVMPEHLDSRPDPSWSVIEQSLDAGDNLEAAMSKTNLHDKTVETIVRETASLISEHERKVFGKVIAGERELPFSVLARHLFKAGKRFPLITTNYDRLIEFATEAAGFGVDSRFVGYLHGHLDAQRASDAHREAYYSGRNAAFRKRPCLSVFKPHGSLDWFDIGDRIVRCPVESGKAPVIITPGTDKYQKSFQYAFDDQRNAGNRAASSANRLLFIGYGFNDDHLEHYLCPNLTLAKPTVIITQQLSQNAQRLIENSKNTSVLALSAAPGVGMTKIVNQDGETALATEQLWHLEGFNKGVL